MLAAYLDRLGHHEPAATISGFVDDALRAELLPRNRQRDQPICAEFSATTPMSPSPHRPAMTNAAMAHYALEQIDRPARDLLLHERSRHERRHVSVHRHRGFDPAVGGRRRAMRAALEAHDEVLREAVEAHDGWLFKHTGDGVCAAFASPRAAVDAAVAAQRALELPVRMGIATGEAELRGGDYFGAVLNRAARVMAAGHGGQILLDGATAALLTDVDLIDLGHDDCAISPSRSRCFRSGPPACAPTSRR